MATPPESDDDESLQESCMEFEKRGGTTDHGKEYEVLMCTLVFLRALQRTRRFWLASNHAQAGAFDDVVLLWKTTEEDESLAGCLVQLKYKAKKIVTKHLLYATSTKKDDFSLLKYFKSFHDFDSLWKSLGEIPMRNVFYVLFTNAPIDGLLDVGRADGLNELVSLLGSEQGDVVTFDGKENVEKILSTAGNDMEEVKDFLRRFTLWHSQAGPEGLRKVLRLELKNYLALGDGEEETIAELLEDAISKWWISDTECHYLTESSSLWKDIIFGRVAEVNHKRADAAVYKFELRFSCGRELRKLLLPGHVYVLVVTTELSVVRITQALEGRSSVLVVSEVTHEELCLWKGYWCDTLVVVGASAVGIETMEEVLQTCPWKRVVLVMWEKPSICKWPIIEDSFSVDDLKPESKEKLLSLEVSFQGHIVALRSLFVDDEAASRLLTAEHIFHLVTSRTRVNIGSTLSTLSHPYLPRVLSRCHTVRKDFFTAVFDCGDICAVIGISDAHFRFWLGQLGDNLRNFQNGMISLEESIPFFVVLPSRVLFRDLCDKFPSRNVHLLEYGDNGIWKWLETNGSDLALVRQHLEPSKEVFKEMEDRCTVIAGCPGMGKSALLATTATEVKKREPWLWVLRIDLSAHTKLLARNDLTVQQFIEEAALDCDQQHSLSLAVLRHCVWKSGYLVLLLDGFDEIYLNYAARFVSLVNDILQTTAVRRVLVSTRPSPRHMLEDSFRTLAYDMEPLSQEEQTDLLGATIISSVPFQKLGDLLGIPLFASMLSQVLTSTGVSAVSDVRVLYEKFVEMKVKIVFEEKFCTDLTKPGVARMYKNFLRQCTERFQKLALELFLGPEEKVNISFLQEEEEDEDDMDLLAIAGVAVRQGEGEAPLFVHRTFAEYFLATWASRSFRDHRDLIAVLLFRDDMDFFRDMLNRFLCRAERVHCAVINGETQCLVEKDMARRDAGGRTPLHLCALYDNAAATRVLLRSGCAWDVEDIVLGWTAMHYAAVLNAWEFMDSAIEGGQEVEITGDPKHILDHCCRRGKVHLLQYILQKTTYRYDSPIGDLGDTCLHIAARHGHAAVISVLLDGAPDVDVRNVQNETPLHVSEHEGTVQHLLRANAARNLTDNYGGTALHNAARKGRQRVVELLVEEGFDVNVADRRDGATPLLYAASEGHEEVTVFLLPRVANVNAADNIGNTALHRAAANEHTRLLDLLVDAHMDLESRSTYGYTPLLLAVALGRDSAVNVLLARGADRTATLPNGATALHLAASSGHEKLVSNFLEIGVERRDTDGETPLMYAARSSSEAFRTLAALSALDVRGEACSSPMHYAAARGKIDVVEHLLDAGQDPNERNKFGWTPLTSAVWNSHGDIVSLLIRRGADVNTADDCGDTSLHKAAFRGDEAIARHLLQAGAAVDVRRKDGSTPLQLSAIEGHVSLARFLLGQGAAAEAVDNRGNGALYTAAAFGHIELVSLLLEQGLVHEACDKAMLKAAFEKKDAVVRALVTHGASVNCRDDRGATALFHAACGGQKDLAEFLLHRGAEVDAGGWDGATPLQYAVRWGKDDVAETLLRHNARCDFVDGNGNTMLILAASQGMLATVRVLVEMGYVDVANKRGVTALLAAASEGSVDVVECLVNHGTSKYAVDAEGGTVMHYAAKGGSVALLKSFMTDGFKADVADSLGRTPLIVATAAGHTEAVRWFLEEAMVDSEVRDAHGYTALHLAVKGGNLKLTQYLVSRGFDAEAASTHGTTPLLLAAELGREVMVRWLVSSAGVRTDTADADGDTLLHCVALTGRQSLLSYALDVVGVGATERVNRRGETPLLTAVAQRNSWFEFPLLLAERSARIDVVDNDGNSVLHLAARNGNQFLLRAFQIRNVDPTTKNKQGLTAADLAKRNGHAQLANMLENFKESSSSTSAYQN